VLGALMGGKPADEIATEQFVSVATVRTHIRSVLRKLGEVPETRVFVSFAEYRHRLAMLCNPSRNPLPQAEFQPIQEVLVRILGSAQYQIVPFKYVYKTRIAFHYFDGEVQNSIKRLVKTVSRGNAANRVV